MTPVMHTDGEGKELVDLAATFGRRYRVTREADGATWFHWPEADRPWLLEIRGHYTVWCHPTVVGTCDAPRIGRASPLGFSRLPASLTRGEVPRRATSA